MKKNLIPHIIELNNIKHLWINVTKYVQDLYTETAKYCQGRFTEDLIHNYLLASIILLPTENEKVQPISKPLGLDHLILFSSLCILEMYLQNVSIVFTSAINNKIKSSVLFTFHYSVALLRK